MESGTELFDSSGKAAVITGSSRGIGRAIVEAYGADGAHVVIASRKQAAFDAVAVAINARDSEERAAAIAASIFDKAALRCWSRKSGPASAGSTSSSAMLR